MSIFLWFGKDHGEKTDAAGVTVTSFCSMKSSMASYFIYHLESLSMAASNSEAQRYIRTDSKLPTHKQSTKINRV